MNLNRICNCPKNKNLSVNFETININKDFLDKPNNDS